MENSLSATQQDYGVHGQTFRASQPEEQSRGSFAGKLIIAVKAVKTLIIKIITRIARAIRTVTLCCRCCRKNDQVQNQADRNSRVDHPQAEEQDIPGVTEERRQTPETVSDPLPSPKPESSAPPHPFTPADPDELHRIRLTADDVNPANLPALPEPADTDPDKKKLRLGITGLKLMADEHFPAMLDSFRVNERDLHNARMTMGIPDKITFARIPDLLEKIGRTEPLTRKQIINLYLRHQSHASAPAPWLVQQHLVTSGILREEELDDLIDIADIPRTLEELRASLSDADMTLPETFPVNLHALVKTLLQIDQEFEDLPSDDISEPVQLLDFMITAIQTCNRQEYIRASQTTDFCNALACTRNYYYWFSELREKQGIDSLKMKRQVLNQIMLDLDKHNIVIIPCNHNRDLLQLTLDKSDPQNPVVKGKILSVRRKDCETDSAAREHKVETREERPKVKSITLEPVDYRKLESSSFMDMLTIDGFDVSQWLASWPGCSSFDGEEHTCKHYQFACFLPLIKENFPPRERAIIKLQLHETVESTLEQALEKMPVVQQAIKHRQVNMPETDCYYRRLNITLAKTGRIDGVPDDLRDKLANHVFKHTRSPENATADNYKPLPANIPDNNVAANKPMIVKDRAENPGAPVSYVAGQWHTLPSRQAGHDIFDYIAKYNEEIMKLARIGVSRRNDTFRKIQTQQAIIHLCEQLPDASDPAWDKPRYSDEKDIAPLFAILTNLIKTNLISARGIENLSAHEAVLVFKLFAICLKLRLEYYEGKSETALSDDVRKHGKKLVHHYATDMLAQFNKIQRYLSLESYQDRNTLQTALRCIRALARFKDGRLDQEYLLLKPDQHLSPKELRLKTNIPEHEWKIPQAIALGPISVPRSSMIPQDNSDIVVLTDLLNRHFEFAVREYVAKKISPRQRLTGSLYDEMERNNSFECTEDQKIAAHFLSNDYEKIKNNPLLFNCLVRYFYCSRDARGLPFRYNEFGPPRMELNSTFAANYGSYPAEWANYYVLRELKDATAIVCGPNFNNSMRYYRVRTGTEHHDHTETGSSPVTGEAYTFQHVKHKEECSDSGFNTQFYMPACPRMLNNKRQTHTTSKATRVAQDIMAQHIGPVQNALYQKHQSLDQPLIQLRGGDFFDEGRTSELFPHDMLILFRAIFQTPYVDNHHHLLMFMNNYAHYLSHPTIQPLVELAWFGDLRQDSTQDDLANPAVARTLMDLVIRRNQDAIPFIEQMAGLFRKLKIYETSPDREKYTGNYGQSVNAPRLLGMKILAGAINNMAFHPNAKVSLDVRQRAEKLLIQIWDEEVRSLPENIQSHQDHRAFSNTCTALLALFDKVHACCSAQLQERAVDMLERIACHNTWNVNLPDFLDKCGSVSLGQEMNAALRAIRHLEPIYLARADKTTAARSRKTPGTLPPQSELTIGHDTYAVIPMSQVPAGLKKTMSSQKTREPLTTLSFCCPASELPHPKTITVINVDTRVVIARFDTSSYTLSRATPVREGDTELPEARCITASQAGSSPVAELIKFASPDRDDSVSILWADKQSGHPVAIEVINGEWQFHIRDDHHWEPSCFPGYFVTCATNETLHLVADNNTNIRKFILKEKDRYFCYDMDGNGNITGYPDGHESMAAYLFYQLNQRGAPDYHCVTQCQAIIAEFRRSGRIFEHHWQEKLNRMLACETLQEKPFARLLLLELAACQYLNNPERLANGIEHQEAVGIQQMYLGYLADRRELEAGDQLTYEEERVLLQALANKANERRFLQGKTGFLGRKLYIHDLIIERSRLFDNELHNQLRHSPRLDIPDENENNDRRSRLLATAQTTDKYWLHDLDLLPMRMLNDQQTMDIIRGKAIDKPLPRPVGNGLAPDSHGFLCNIIYYYDIARNPEHPERPQLEQFLARIARGEPHVQNLVMFLQSVLEKPWQFGPAEVPPDSDPAPDPTRYDLPADYDRQIDESRRNSWKNPEVKVFTHNPFKDPCYPKARAYLRDCEYHKHRQQPLGMLSWYFFQVHQQNREQLHARAELKMLDRVCQFHEQHGTSLPILTKVRLNYPDVPPCEPVQYLPLEWQCHEGNNDNVAASFQATLDILHERYGHLATEGIKLLTPIAPEEKARQLQVKTAETAELREQLKTARDAVGDDNPCLAYPLERLVKGLDIHATQIEQEKMRPGYRLGATCTEISAALPELEKHLSQRREQLKEQVNRLEKELLAQINSFDTLDTAIRHRLKTFKAISILELVSVIGKGRESQLAELHPEWDDAKRRQVVRQCIEYLLHSTELQHMERILPQCQQLQTLVNSIQNAGSDELTDDAKLLQEQLVGLIVQERAYCGDSSNSQTRLEFLLFEHIMNIRIRPDQVESCLKLDEHVRVNAEIPTGSGKSTLILPYLCYKAWLDGKSPILVVPPELIEQQKGILKNGLCKIFGTDLSELHFDRERARNPEYLSALLDRLKTDHRKKHILLCRMNELHAIICLQKKEILFQLGFSDRDKITLNKALEKLDELQRFIEENCNFIIDESRTNFNPNHSYDYAVGRQVPQSDVTREAMKHIFQVIHQHLKDDYVLDFMGSANTGKTIITREIYRETIIVTLADNLVPLFITQSAHELNRNKKLLADLAACGHHFNDPLSQQDADTIRGILTRLMRQDLTMKPLQPAERNILNAFLDNHFKRPLYATIREALGTTMENTLCRKADDSYGLNEDATRVIPYTNGIPKPEAEFGSPLVNTILTVQAFLFTPISRIMMRRWITTLKQLEQELPLDEVQDHPQMRLFFEIIRQYGSLNGITPSRLSTIEIDQICEYLNKPDNFNLKLAYICDVILPTMKMYPRKVTSSAFSIVSFCSRLKTASGTVDVNVLPRELMTLEAEQAPVPNLMKLLQGKWHEPALRIEATRDEKQRLLNIVRQCPKATVIIDAGDCFRSLSHQEIADCLHAEIYSGNSQSAMANTQGILVFDHNGVAWVKKRAGGKLVLFDNCGIAPDQLAIAMQKNKAEGTDWKMHIKAHGVVTVDRTTDLSLMIQAVGRMRQLQKGQSVQLAYMREQEALLLGKDETTWTSSRPEGDCTNGALVQYLARVEGQHMMKQAVPLLNNFIRARLEQTLYTDFPRHVEFSEQATTELVKKTREFLVPLTHTDPVNFLGNERITLTLKEMADRVFAQYIPVINEARAVHPWLEGQLDMAALRREYDDFIAGVVLPKTFDTLSGSVNNAADLTSEVTTTQEKEQEVEVEVTSTATALQLDYNLQAPVDWNGNLLEWTKNRVPAFCLGKTQVYFGPNTTQFAASRRWGGFERHTAVSINPLNDKYHKPVYHAMYFQREGEAHDVLFLGDVEDMKRVRQYIDTHATETSALQPSHGKAPQPGTSTQLDTGTQPGATTQPTTEHIWRLDGVTDGCYIQAGKEIIMTFGNGRFAAAENDDDKRRIMLMLKLSAHALADRAPYKTDKEALRFWMQQSPEDAVEIKAYFERIQNSDNRMTRAITCINKD